MRGADASVIAVVVLTALVAFAAPALAQVDPDENTISNCESDHTTPALEAACPLTVALHLRDALGENAELYAWIYGGALAVAIVVWLLILFWRILPRRYIRLQAADTIREVAAGNPATYVLTVENRRKRRPVEVELAVSHPPQGWAASVAIEKPLPSGFKELVGEGEAMRVPLSARKAGANMADVKVTVTTPPGADPDQWSELDVTAIPYVKDAPRARRGKDQKVVTLIKNPESHPRIDSVSHEPAVFRLHDEVTTTVVVANTGEEQVDDLTVFLYVNDDEVARETVAIPPGGEACLEFPWRADASESRVRVALAA